LLRIGKLGLLAGALGPVALRGWAADSQPEFKFIVVNDTHYLGDECGNYLAGLVKQMNAEQPAFVLHAGDLTDKGKAAHLKAVRKIFGKLDASFYPVIGNHDWLTPTDRKAYLATFPLKLNYSFRHAGWQFIGLDTTEGQKYFKTRIQPATFDMLDDIQGRLDKAKPTVVFTHFPLCAEVRTRPTNAEELLAKFDGWNVRAMFSGHYHAFTECRRGEAPITTNRCCALKRHNHDGTKEKGYFVCSVSEGRLTRNFVEYKGA
jgi:3',5'-cyclic AMP phosphodiesterase CpdA